MWGWMTFFFGRKTDLTQRRKGAKEEKAFAAFLCAFAPLRETFSS
jgi:hypothetical protein